MRIISWQSLLTSHQYFLWAEMKELGHDINFIIGSEEDDSRIKQGWTTSVQTEEIPLTLLPQKDWWKTGKRIIQENKDSIHIFGGFWADKRFFPLILYSLFNNVKTAVMNESFSEEGSGYQSDEKNFGSNLKKHLRPLFYRLAIFFSKINKVKFCLLAISPLAVEQFLASGLKKNQVFPFGYFVPKQEFSKKVRNQSIPLRTIFAGTLIKRKGIDLLIQAVEQINQKEQLLVTLDIFGYGDPDKWIPKKARGITYKGMIPFGHAQEVFRNYDYLILPSRHDGWGVVVNEALLQGVPVIISDHVGSKALIEKSGAGLLFESNNLESLRNVLNSLASNPIEHERYAARASAIAEKITPQAAAQYLEEILQYYFYSKGQRPIPNWER